MLFSRAQSNFARHRIKEALSYHEKALEFGLNPDRGALDRWTCYMLLGRFEDAWRETDRTEAIRRRLRVPQENLPLHFRRVWNGDDLEGRTVLVRCYHGLGDTIQFARYIPLVKKIARRVIVQCPAQVARLIASVAGVDEIICLGNASVDCEFDVDIELMELPYAFRTTPVNVPCRMPYVSVPRELTARMATRIAELESGSGERKARAGVVWQSGSWNPERSIRFEDIARITNAGNVNVFSLQCGAEMRGVPFGCRRGRLIHLENEPPKLLGTAALILNLDLVISVDTMVAHLAGALGKPVWTLLPFAADWRWMLDRNDSPWYPTMRLYRQTQRGDWRAVITRVADELSHSFKGAGGCNSDRAAGWLPNAAQTPGV